MGRYFCRGQRRTAKIWQIVCCSVAVFWECSFSEALGTQADFAEWCPFVHSDLELTSLKKKTASGLHADPSQSNFPPSLQEKIRRRGRIGGGLSLKVRGTIENFLKGGYFPNFSEFFGEEEFEKIREWRRLGEEILAIEKRFGLQESTREPLEGGRVRTIIRKEGTAGCLLFEDHSKSDTVSIDFMLAACAMGGPLALNPREKEYLGSGVGNIRYAVERDSSVRPVLLSILDRLPSILSNQIKNLIAAQRRVYGKVDQAEGSSASVKKYQEEEFFLPFSEIKKKRGRFGFSDLPLLFGALQQKRYSQEEGFAIFNSIKKLYHSHDRLGVRRSEQSHAKFYLEIRDPMREIVQEKSHPFRAQASELLLEVAKDGGRNYAAVLEDIFLIYLKNLANQNALASKGAVLQGESHFPKIEARKRPFLVWGGVLKDLRTSVSGDGLYRTASTAEEPPRKRGRLEADCGGNLTRRSFALVLGDPSEELFELRGGGGSPEVGVGGIPFPSPRKVTPAWQAEQEKGSFTIPTDLRGKGENSRNKRKRDPNDSGNHGQAKRRRSSQSGGSVQNRSRSDDWGGRWEGSPPILKAGIQSHIQEASSRSHIQKAKILKSPASFPSLPPLAQEKFPEPGVSWPSPKAFWGERQRELLAWIVAFIFIGALCSCARGGGLRPSLSGRRRLVNGADPDYYRRWESFAPGLSPHFV